jgi:hypothetical protein
MVSSAIMVGVSFYFFITGAHIFANRETTIVYRENTEIKQYQDSVTTIYNNKIQVLDDEINKLRELNKSSIENISTAGPRMSKILNQQISGNNLLIKENEKDVKNLKTELKNNIEVYRQEIESKNTLDKENNEANIFRFMLISVMIELFIIIGIWFNQFFKFKSYKEYLSKYDGIVEKKKIYDLLLKLIYNDGINKPGDVLISENKMVKVAQIKSGNSIKIREVKNFFTEITHIGVIQSQKNKRIVKEDYETAIHKMDAMIFNGIPQ